VLIPATYAAAGWVLYRNKGWRFFQPGVGGRRFVSLNGVAWAFYAVALAVQLVNIPLHDPLLRFNAFMISALAYVLMLGSLFTYHPPKSPHRGATATVQVPATAELDDVRHYSTPTFNAELQHSVLMRNQDSSPSLFWWIFIGMQVSLTLTAFVVCIAGSLSEGSLLVRMLTTTVAMWTFSAACAITHALGGKWRHIRTNYAAFQPGRGGFAYVALQALGWMAFATSTALGLLALQAQWLAWYYAIEADWAHMLAGCGVLGVLAEGFLVSSLFLYRDDPGEEDIAGFQRMVHADETGWRPLLFRFVRLQFKILNWIFGPANPETATRAPKQRDPNAHLACDDKWAQLTRKCRTTGDCYLVVGNGFVGKRLVNRLLERGETNVRVFDIVENNPWKGDSRVTFIRGDVTKLDDISEACRGVHTIYSTFAIIRFMERLEHQAFLSYHINVTGTETLVKACKEQSCKRLIVTSSSHATTDEFSEPRFGRDETAKFVTREDAHNHYGWTKAIADSVALNADGAPLADGGQLEVTVVRPCSGVFGADDRLSFEKVMDLRIAPGVGAKAVMDWVYVDNVVLGHLLAEAGLQNGLDGVRGEAFCISNDDPVSMEDFWMLTRKHIALLPKPEMRHRLAVDFVWIPEAPLWVIGYVSEMVQRVFKGRVSLGQDLDMLTPAMLSTVTMSYTYSSEKARKVLGYEPAFTLDEAIQRSLCDYYSTHFAPTPVKVD